MTGKQLILSTRKTIQITLSLTLVLICFVICRQAEVQAASADKDEVISRVVQNWIEICRKQYEDHLYEQAQNSLVRATSYQESLNENQLQKLTDLDSKIHKAMVEREQVLTKLDAAAKLIDHGDFLEAREYFIEVEKSGHLDKTQEQRVEHSLKRLDAKIDEQRQQMKELYQRSREHYKNCEFEEAKEGFALVASSGLYEPRFGKSAEDYLAMIGQQSVQKQEEKNLSDRGGKSQSESWFWQSNTEEKTMSASPEQEDVESARKRVPQETISDAPSNQGDSRWEPGNKAKSTSTEDRNLKQSYVEVVVRDAEAKVAELVGKAEFDSADNVIENASNILNKFKVEIGQKFHAKQDEKLDRLSYMVQEQQRLWESRWDSEK